MHRAKSQVAPATAAIRTLSNPRYAGAYAYGQRAYGRTVEKKSGYDFLREVEDGVEAVVEARQ